MFGKRDLYFQKDYFLEKTGFSKILKVQTMDHFLEKTVFSKILKIQTMF